MAKPEHLLLLMEVPIKARSELEGRYDMRALSAEAPSVFEAMQKFYALVAPTLKDFGASPRHLVAYVCDTDRERGTLNAQVLIRSSEQGGLAEDLIKAADQRVDEVSQGLRAMVDDPIAARGQVAEQDLEKMERFTHALQVVAAKAEGVRLEMFGEVPLEFARDDFVLDRAVDGEDKSYVVSVRVMGIDEGRCKAKLSPLAAPQGVPKVMTVSYSEDLRDRLLVAQLCRAEPRVVVRGQAGKKNWILSDEMTLPRVDIPDDWAAAQARLLNQHVTVS